MNMNKTYPEELLPLNLAARCLRVPMQWLSGEIEAGRLPALRAGRATLVHVPTLAPLLAERAKGESSSPANDSPEPCPDTDVDDDDDDDDDDAILRSAISKEEAGEPLTREEDSVLRRAKRELEERTRWEYYATIPQKHWRQMSGRQAKVLQEQAVRYGIPFGGATVDLSAVVRLLHDFLRDNGRKLVKAEAVDRSAPRLLSEIDAAKYLGVGARTLWGLRNEGKIPVVRVGRMVRYDRQDLEAWILEHKSGTPKENPGACAEV